MFCIFKCSQLFIDDKRGVLSPCCLGYYLKHSSKYEDKHLVFGTRVKTEQLKIFLGGMRRRNSVKTFDKHPCIRSMCSVAEILSERTSPSKES